MKTVIITGASRGIGLATAKKFLHEGWRVIGTYFHTKIPIPPKMNTNPIIVLSLLNKIFVPITAPKILTL